MRGWNKISLELRVSLLFIGVVLTFAWCFFLLAPDIKVRHNDRQAYLDPTVRVDENDFPLDSGTLYFPPMAFRTWEMWTVPSIEVFSYDLRVLQEPILYHRMYDKEVFRWTWRRTFDPAITIRIEREGENIQLYWKISDGPAGFDLGVLMLSRHKEISLASWEKFTELAEREGYWRLPVMTRRRGFDGAHWIIEGANNKYYKIVHRWSPGKDDPIHKMGMFLLELAGLTETEEIY